MAERPDISLQELLADVLDSQALELHTAMPGIVKSYNQATQRADVQPAIKRVIDGEAEELPTIKDVPVCWPAGGGFILTLPMTAGDSVLLVFSECAWGPYLDSGQLSKPGDLARHSLSYPVAIPFGRLPNPTALGANLFAPTPFSVGVAATAGAVAKAAAVTALYTAAKADIIAAGGAAAALTALDTPPGTFAALATSTKLKAD